MRTLTLALGLAALSVAPAAALDATFSATVSNTCTLTLGTPGVMKLSTDGLTLASDETLGLPAEVTILSLGSNRVTVEPPEWISSPAAYSPSGETRSVRYTGLGGLSLINQAYTSASSSFNLVLLPLSVLLVHSRIQNNNGFAQGNYSAKTVVTCG